MRTQITESIAEIISAITAIGIVSYIFYILATTPNPLQNYFEGIVGDIIFGLIFGFIIGIVTLILWLISNKDNRSSPF